MDGPDRPPTPELRRTPLPKTMAKVLPGSILSEVYVSLAEHRKCHIHRRLQITQKALNMLLSRFYESVIPSVPEALARNPSRNAQKANKRGP